MLKIAYIIVFVMWNYAIYLLSLAIYLSAFRCLSICFRCWRDMRVFLLLLLIRLLDIAFSSSGNVKKTWEDWKGPVDSGGRSWRRARYDVRPIIFYSFVFSDTSVVDECFIRVCFSWVDTCCVFMCVCLPIVVLTQQTLDKAGYAMGLDFAGLKVKLGHFIKLQAECYELYYSLS